LIHLLQLAEQDHANGFNTTLGRSGFYPINYQVPFEFSFSIGSFLAADLFCVSRPLSHCYSSLSNSFRNSGQQLYRLGPLSVVGAFIHDENRLSIVIGQAVEDQKDSSI
jgi:hypothetical protein